MNVKRVEFTEAERKQIEAELGKDHPAHVYKRLMALKFKAVDGMRSDEAGKLLGMYPSSVNRIVNRYKAEGMEAIVGKRHHGGHRYMTLEQETAFLAGFREQGEAGKVIEVTEIHLAFQEAVGHPVSRDTIYYLLKKHEWRKVMPRGQHPKKASDEAIEAYKKTREAIQDLKKMQPNLRVMFQDEAGFGRINKPKRCWCPAGIRPRWSCQEICVNSVSRLNKSTPGTANRSAQAPGTSLERVRSTFSRHPSRAGTLRERRRCRPGRRLSLA